MGLALADGKTDMMQAVLEGVALRTCEVLAAMDALVPFVGPVSIDGGLTQSEYFLHFLSEVAGHDLFLPTQTEQTATGLALMAAEASGQVWPEPRPGMLLERQPNRSAERRAAFTAARLAVEGYAKSIATVQS